MSIIAFKIGEEKVEVACDGRVSSGDKIICDNKVKIAKAPNKRIICGETGLSNYNDIWKEYIIDNEDIVYGIKNTSDALKFAVKFKKYIIDEFHCTDDVFAEFGDFFFITPHYHCVINYDKDAAPYLTHSHSDEVYGCFGSTDYYTEALLSTGMDIEEAIRKTAEKFTSISKVTYKLSFDLN